VEGPRFKARYNAEYLHQDKAVRKKGRYILLKSGFLTVKYRCSRGVSPAPLFLEPCLEIKAFVDEISYYLTDATIVKSSIVYKETNTSPSQDKQMDQLVFRNSQTRKQVSSAQNEKGDYCPDLKR
jgi:hypothetical protein